LAQPNNGKPWVSTLVHTASSFCRASCIAAADGTLCLEAGTSVGSPLASLPPSSLDLSAQALDEAEKALRYPFTLPDVKLPPSLDAKLPGHVSVWRHGPFPKYGIRKSVRSNSSAWENSRCLKIPDLVSFQKSMHKRSRNRIPNPRL
jgi:hypothetical protein